MSRVDASLMAGAFGVKSKLRSIVLDHLLNADLKEQVQRPSQPSAVQMWVRYCRRNQQGANLARKMCAVVEGI
jgi:hypothetical protein